MATTRNFDGLRDEIGGKEKFVVTDWTEDLTLDCNTDNAALGNLVGTLIKALMMKGILKGSVTTT